MPTSGIEIIDNSVEISNALVIAFGLTLYWAEKTRAINPTGAAATIIVVSDIENSISFKCHIIKIATNGCKKILNPMIKLETFSSVCSIFWESIIPAAKRAQGAADPEINSKALFTLVGKSISKKRTNKPVRTAKRGRFENCFKIIFF